MFVACQSRPCSAALIAAAASCILLACGESKVSGRMGSEDLAGPDVPADVAAEVAPDSASGACTTDDDCPEGFACVMTRTPDGGDEVRVCLDVWLALCQPCRDDEVCRPNAATAGALCVTYPGGEGSFCGVACAEDDDCPEGYDCLEPEGLAEGGDKQCVATELACECSARAAEQAAETNCGVGVCAGTRSCGTEGLSACDGPAPSTEACDGLDNDCDGATDEDWLAGGRYVADDHCGSCDETCVGVVEHGTAACEVVDGSAACVLVSCEPGFVEGPPGVCAPEPVLADDCGACATDEDCAEGLSCEDLGAGRFCLRACAPGGEDCPSGLSCSEDADADPRCLLESGGCAAAGSTCGEDAACEDLDPCTIGSCIEDACAFELAADGAACDDGDPCTGDDACDGGTCTGTATGCGAVTGFEFHTPSAAWSLAPVGAIGLTGSAGHGSGAGLAAAEDGGVSVLLGFPLTWPAGL